VDLDGDGIPDILSGSWPGQLYFFKGIGKGKFAGKQALKDKGGKVIKIGNASTVFAVDWNGDGKLDLLIGDIAGHVHIMLNEGTAQALAFGKPQKLSVEGEPIRVPHGDSHPIAADWDGDMLLDLLVGCGDGGVLFYKNIGTAKEPKLAKPQALVAAGKHSEKTITPALRAKICVVDWNGDGRRDLLVGDFCQYEAVIEIPDKDRKAVEEARKKQKEIDQKDMDLRKKYLVDAMAGKVKKETPVETEIRMKKLREVSDKYEDFEQGFTRDLNRLANLNKLANPSGAEQKEMALLRTKLDATCGQYVAMMDEVLPYALEPFDEPPEKTKARLAKIKAHRAARLPLRIESALLREITQPYDPNQMAGSVWLYRRQEPRLPE
jgi:hypothetical protein